MKNILILSLICLFGCTYPVLKPHEYEIVDTIRESNNGFGYTLGYDVIIKYDSSFYYGYIDRSGRLTKVEFRPIKIK